MRVTPPLQTGKAAQCRVHYPSWEETETKKVVRPSRKTVFQRPVNPVYLCKKTFFAESKAFFQHWKSSTGTNTYLKQQRWQFGCPAALNRPLFWMAFALVFKENRKKNVRLGKKEQ